jgi:hypothetical protein
MNPTEQNIINIAKYAGAELESYDPYSIGYFYGSKNFAVPSEILFNDLGREWTEAFYQGLEDGTGDRDFRELKPDGYITFEEFLKNVTDYL